MQSTAKELPLLDFLQTDEASATLNHLSHVDTGDATALPLLTDLRRTFSADQAGTLLTQARLRKRAAAKFPQADVMLFEEEALEQATAWQPALHRARRVDEIAPPGPIQDLGCGIGGDLLALAQFRPVLAWERDPVRLDLARYNVAALSPPFPVEFRPGDWTANMAVANLPTAGAAYVDPARRVQGRRVFSLSAIQPPLTTLLELSRRVPLLVVKVMPGIRDAELPESCAIEFVSHAGVCKEAVLWFGDSSLPRRWASIHDGLQWHELPTAGEAPPQGELTPGQILYEPDPALIRAGAIAELCTLLHAHQFEPEIAYLVANEPRRTPFADAFRLLEVHPFNIRFLNERLNALGIAHVELKKRGFPQEPESLRPRLRLQRQGRSGVVIFTRRATSHWMLICERLPPNASD